MCSQLYHFIFPYSSVRALMLLFLKPRSLVMQANQSTFPPEPTVGQSDDVMDVDSPAVSVEPATPRNMEKALEPLTPSLDLPAPRYLFPIFIFRRSYLDLMVRRLFSRSVCKRGYSKVWVFKDVDCPSSYTAVGPSSTSYAVTGWSFFSGTPFAQRICSTRTSASGANVSFRYVCSSLSFQTLPIRLHSKHEPYPLCSRLLKLPLQVPSRVIAISKQSVGVGVAAMGSATSFTESSALALSWSQL